MKLIGIVTDVDGKYFAKDKDGNVRRLKVGDKVYAGEEVYGDSDGDRIVIESPTSNEKIVLFGTDKLIAGEFGHVEHTTPLAKESHTQLPDDKTSTTTKISHSNATTQTQDEAVGFQEIFLARTGKIINVEAALLDATNEDKDFKREITNDSLPFNPLPTLTTNLSQVDDNYYDAHLASGTNTAKNSFTFEALSGFKTLQVGTQTFSLAQLEALGSSPITLSMQAGDLTLDGYSKIDNVYTISYTYKTSGNFTHDLDSDLFSDTLTIVVIDVGGQTTSGILRVDVIDDKPEAVDDVNKFADGQIIHELVGNVFTNDFIGADDESSATPVVALDGGTLGIKFYGSYGELLLNTDGTYTYYLDDSNPDVKVLADGETLTDTYTYTIVDGDGDTSTATLDITIDGHTPKLITNLSEVQDNFYDVYQPSGTDTANNTFTFETLSGFKTLEIGSHSFTLSQIQDFNTTPVNITMGAGIVTLNGYTEVNNVQTISYTYKTSQPYQHDANSDLFADTLSIVITDASGQKVSGSLTVNVLDDMPEAQDDTNSLTEGQLINYTLGNVFLGDTKGGVADNIGADDANKTVPVIKIESMNSITTGTVGSFLDGEFGKIELKADGSYKYIVDNTNPTVRALVDGEELHDLFRYTIIDNDGDATTAELNIKIEGNSSTPQIIAADGYTEESALDAIGTNPSSNSEIFSAHIIGTANDGFDHITFTASDGSTLTINTLTSIDGSQTLDTPQGTLTLLSYNETPYSPGSAIKVGDIAYKYELTSPYANSIVSDVFVDAIDVTITDVNGATGNDTLNISIIDDKPITANDVNVVTEDSSDVVQATGNVLDNDNDGADTNLTPITAQNVAGQYGQFLLNSDGTYIYTLDNDNPIVNALKSGDTLTDTLVYTITDADGDNTKANLDITINGFTDPELSVADVRVVEDGENAGDFKVTFTVSMDITSPRDVTFDYTTVDGTAVDGREYTELAGTATIAAGSTTATITVTLGADDYVADSGKTFDLNISNVNSAGVILDATATATITDDSIVNTPYDNSDVIEDSQEIVTLKVVATDSNGVELADPTANSGFEAGKAFYKVIVVDSLGNPVYDKNGAPASGTVNVVSTDGTAKADNAITGIGDYDGVSPSKTFQVDVNKVFSIDITNDFVDDGGETFSVAVANDQSYSNASDYENVTHDTAAVTTTINEGVVPAKQTTLELSGDVSVVEDGAATYTLTLRDKPETDVTVEITISHIDTDDNDVVANVFNVIIPAGNLTQTFSIDTLGDTVYEGDEDFQVQITNVTHNFESLNVTQDTVVTTIIDNDTPNISVNDITIQEDGTASITVTSDIEAKEDMVFNYTLSAGTATSGEDFTPKTGTVTIAAGEKSAQLNLDSPIDDYFADDSETFSVTISTDDADINITKDTSTVTIDDNTGASTDEVNLDTVTLSLIATDVNGTPLADTTANSMDEGYKAYYKVIMLDKNGNTVLDTSGNVASGSVDIAYVDGSATGGTDYINTLTTVNINQVFDVLAKQDGVTDDGETFDVSIVDGTFTNAADYETVAHDTSAVTTTINDGTVTPVFLYLLDDASVEEADGALLTHTFEFRNGDGTAFDFSTKAVTPSDTITVDLTYTNDATNAADFQTKIVQVVVDLSAGAPFTFSNIVADDFLQEGSESYTLSVATITDNNNYFEDLVDSGDKVTGTITDEATPDEVLVSIVADQIITEGDFSKEFTVSLNQPASDVTSDITVNLAYSGVAQNGVDFIGKTSVIIPAGSNFATFKLVTIQDKLIEGSEDFTITINSINDTNFEAIAADPSADHVNNTIWDDVYANPDTNALKEGGNQVTGNLLINDEVGVNGKVIGFKYFDESGTQQSGTVGIETNTQYGRITVNADGSYTYYSDLQENHPSDGNTDTAKLTDIITYVTKDDNDDTSSSTLTIDVTDTIGSITDSAASSVDEDDLPDGSDTSKESLVITNIHLGIATGADGIESITFDLADVKAALVSLSSHGVALDYTLSSSDQVLTASAGATEVFVVTLNQAGVGSNPSSYNFELKAEIDHLNASGGKLDNLDIKIPFQYKEIGATEDFVKGNLTVNVVDDTPKAVADSDATVVEGTLAPITGNVLTNDIQGADGAELLNFKYTDTAGATQIKWFTTDTTFTVNTPTGMLTVKKSGDWSFTPHSYVDHDDAIQGDTHVGDGSDNDSTQGSFTYSIKDYDTDISNEATQIIHVTDGADPSSGDVVNAIDEDDIAGKGSDQSDPITVNGTLTVNGGSDPFDVTFTTKDSGTLTSNGVAVTYTLSNAGHTLTGMAGSTQVFVANITNPSAAVPDYDFTLTAPLDHPDANAQNTLDFTLEFQTLDIDGDSATSNIIITVTDDIPSIGAPDDSAVDESGLAYGSTPDPTLTHSSGSLAVAQEADSIDTIFDAATITALQNQNLQASLGNALSYTLSNANHTLSASYGGKTYFSVDIKDFDSTNASYEFTLINAIHQDVSGSTETITIPFSVVDFDKDSVSSSFNIAITDDVGATDKQITLNEDGSIAFGVTADDIEPQADMITPHGRISFDDATNLFTYTPDADYSGDDNGIAMDYVVGGVTHTVNIDATILPIADAPLLEADTSLSTDEDTAIALHLKAPVVKDNFDQNDVTPASHDVAGDNPELLGLITLSGLPNGTQVYYGSSIATMDGNPKTIYISDLDKNNDGTVDFISSAAASADYTMTKTEFEALNVIPPLNSGDNIQLKYEVTSYEVDDSGVALGGVSGKTSTQNILIDVHAKTDDGVGVSVADITGDEDNWMRIDDAITITKTLDSDGSEVYELVFDGAKLPAGTLYYLGTPTDMSDRTIGSDASSGFSVSIPDIDDFIAGNYPIYVMTPINDSSDVKDLKVTLNVHDTDSDSTPATDVVKSASDYVDILVTPLANDIEVSSSGAEGDEDSLIQLNLVFTNSDESSEKVTSVTIANIPNDAILFDENGQSVSVAGGSATISIYGGDTSKVEQYKILPPAHSSADITLQVSMTTLDLDDNDGNLHTDTGNIGPIDLVVKINPVSETDSSDTATPSGSDITNVDDHTYTTRAQEDTYFNLNTADGGYTLNVINEDALINIDGSTNPYGSEETFVVFSNPRYFDGTTEISVSGETYIKYNDGSKDIVSKFSSTSPAKIPLEFLDTVELKATQDFSGTMKVDIYVQNQDLGEDVSETLGVIESSSISTLTINMNPVVDKDPVVTLNNINGLEDAGRNADGSINSISAALGIPLVALVESHDKDGSESYTIFADDIPEDAAVYYKNNIIYANSGNSFSSDGIEVTDNGDGTYKIKFTEIDMSVPPVLIPPHNSNDDIRLKINGFGVDTTVLEDGTVVKVEGPLSTPIDMQINITGVADQVVNTLLRGFDIQAETSPTNGDFFSITENADGSGTYNQIVQEDRDTTGVLLELRDIYKTPNELNSYDNIASNNIDNVPVSDTSVATEAVNITVTGLGADFDMQGAILVRGSGLDRVFTFTLADLQDGTTKIVIPENYSGEVDFKLHYITTENDGDSKTSPYEDVKILVTPKAEDLSIPGIEALDMKEDLLESVAIGFAATLPDKSGNPETTDELWVKVADVTNKDFTLFFDDGVSKYNEISTVVASQADIDIVTISGDDYYHFQNDADKNLYIQYSADLGPTPAVDKDINIKISFIDYIDVNGEKIANVSEPIDAVYSLNLEAVTDDIDAKATSITDDDGDANVDIQNESINANGDVVVQVLDNTVLKVVINIDGVDTAGEIDITNPSDTKNGSDYDASEKIISIKIEGVPKGISIENGYYAGDTDLDGDGTTEYTGIWYIDNPQDANGGDLFIDGTSSYNLLLNVSGTIDYGASGYEDQKVGGTLTVTFANQDGSAGIETDPIIVVIDDQLYNPQDETKIPMEITQWDTTANENLIVEDIPIALGSLVNFSVVEMDGTNTNSNFDLAPADGNPDIITSDKFSITIDTLANVTVAGWTQDSFGGSFWTFQGSGGATEIQAALDALILTPNQDYNKNHDTAQGDTSSAFNEGPLTFTTTLTTYSESGLSDTQTLNYIGNVTPVTDAITIDESFDFVDEDGTTHSTTVANEDGTFNIDINITSVDAPYLTIEGTTIKITNSSPNNVGVIVADGSNEVLDGQISWDNGTTWTALNVGDSVNVPKEDIDKVVFQLNTNIAGHVKLDYEAQVLEKDDPDANPVLKTDSVEFDVNPVADGLSGTSGVKIVGNEDEFMELTDSSGNQFSTLTLVDPTEDLTSLVLQGVPVGYLVYVGDDGSQVLTNNLGTDASGNNSWAIDVSGTIPRIWLKAPQDVGGVSSTPAPNWDVLDTIELKTGVTDMGVQVYSTQSVDLTVNAVADSVTLSAQNVNGVEGSEIPLVLDALVNDTDGSEKLSITLKGLGAFAVFKLSGVELDASSVSYDAGKDKYTIIDSAIDFTTIKDLSVIQNDFSGTITVGVQTREISNGDTSAEVSDTFDITITQQPNSSSDDIMLFDLVNGTDGAAGDDTLLFGTDYNSVGIDFTLLDDTLTKNIERVDLTQHGDHTITLNTTDVEAMTDVRNALTIESDSGDNIIIQNDGDNVWAQQASTNVYEDINGATLTINGTGTIDSSALDPDAGDNVLGYNDTNAIDGGAGNDRLIIFDGVEVDFTKVTNIEEIDLDIVGDHTITNLSLNDVIAITDADNDLKIFGSDTDSVNFSSSDNWVKSDTTVSEGGKNFDVYTSANDVSVEVKVQVEIHDSI